MCYDEASWAEEGVVDVKPYPVTVEVSYNVASSYITCGPPDSPKCNAAINTGGTHK